MTDRPPIDNPSPEEQSEEPLNLPVYDEETQERFKASMVDQNVVTMVPKHLFAVVQTEGPDRQRYPHWLKIATRPQGSFDRVYHLPVHVTDPDTEETREVFRPLASASLTTAPAGSIGAITTRTWYKETDGERYGYLTVDAHPTSLDVKMHLTPLELLDISWRKGDGEFRSFIFQPNELLYAEKEGRFMPEERPKVVIPFEAFNQLYDPDIGDIDVPDEENVSRYAGRYNPVDERVYLYEMRKVEGRVEPVAFNEFIIPRFGNKPKIAEDMFPPALTQTPTTSNLRLDQGWMRESPQGASGAIWRRLRPEIRRV